MESCVDDNGNSIETQTLKEFRRQLSDVLKPDVSDAILMKWLRTNNFNLRKSVKLYKEYTWAKNMYKTDDTDNFHPKEVIDKYEFISPLGFAKDGTPVSYLSIGKGDMIGFVYSVDVLEICKHSSYVMERDLKKCREQSKKLGKEINSVTYIADFEYFSIRQLFVPGMMELGLDLFQVLQDHYPEIWNRILIINVPATFQALMNIFKPILRSTFVQKIYLASKERSPDLLLRFIDPEVLPAFLGGTRLDSKGNPLCTGFLKFGGKIPEHYYALKQFKLQPTDPDVKDVWIPPRSSYNYTVVVKEADSVLRFEYRTEGGSIGGKILYREFDDDDLENLHLPATDEHLDENDENSPWKRVSPFAHIQTHISPMNNFGYAPWPGIYVCVFDNTNSWITGKRFICRIRALPPGTKPY